MKVVLYARVSTEAQASRGTIGSQVEVLEARAATEGHEVVGRFCDDGCSGARLDRPGLDALRDAAEAGGIEAVWCLTPDRLARNYAYQFLVTEELARHGVKILFTDAPALDDDPQARLLTQMQGVIAEYERAKIAERNRRGKLWRAPAGEAVQWQAPYGFRRLPRSAAGPAHLEVHEPEAAVVRAIFDHYTAGGLSMRQITRRLADDQIPSPSGRAVWNISTISGLLTNRAYIGSWYYNRSESLPAKGPTGSDRRRARPAEEWIPIPVPPIVTEDTFDAAQAVSRDNSAWSPRNTTPGAWLLRGLVVCGACGVRISCRQMKPKAKIHRYYWCQNHDPLRAGGEDRRCPERHIRADELDDFVFDQVRQALLRPDVLLAGEMALAAATPTPDDELLTVQLGKLDRRVERTETERRRLIDLYQTGLIDKNELTRRAADIDARHRQLQAERTGLIEQRSELTRGNQLRRRVTNFAKKVTHAIDELDFEQRQQLLRLVVEEVRVKGWHVEIKLRIPLEERPEQRPTSGPAPEEDDPPPGPTSHLSTDMRLRSARRGRTRGVLHERQGSPWRVDGRQRRPARPDGRG